MESHNSNICKYLLDDIKFFKQRSDDEGLSLEIYLKNATEALLFSVQNHFSMRDPQIIMVEQVSYNPPLRTVINAEDIAAYSFTLYDEYDDENDGEEDDEEGGIFNFLHGRK